MALNTLVADVDSSGAAAEVDIRPEDVILEVNHQSVRSAADIKAALQKPGTGPALLLVSRGDEACF